MQTTYWRPNDQLALILCLIMQLLPSEIHPQVGLSKPLKTSGATPPRINYPTHTISYEIVELKSVSVRRL